jgi:Tfp pilus assembly protein PilO
MKKQKVIFLLVVTGVILSGLVFSFYVRSKISSIHALRSSIENVSKADDETRSGKSKNVRRIDSLKRLFPQKGDTAVFIEEVYRIGKQRALKNLTFEQKSTQFIEPASGGISKTVRAPSQKVIYAYPFRISFNAGYRNSAEFIREIQNIERFVTMESISVKREKESLAVELVVSIYSTEER